MMMMMISSTSQETTMNEPLPLVPITTTTSPTWKLYENPFYNSTHSNQQQQQQLRQSNSSNNKPMHQIKFPISARKIAASFWDLSFIRPVMETELELARAQILELKAEVEFERKARKKAETMSKRLAKELAEERRGREALERVCEKLAKEVSSDRSEIDRMKKGMEEERKMLRMAEVLREERVQMKLTEAKILLEEKMLELEGSKRMDSEKVAAKIQKSESNATLTSTLSGKFSKLVLGDNNNNNNNNNSNHNNGSTIFGSREPTRLVLLSTSKSLSLSSCNDNVSSSVSSSQRRTSSTEPENPHITRGIKGFVEFPRVAKAIGSKSRHWGTKLECQKAQLRILLKQKCPIRSNNLIIG